MVTSVSKGRVQNFLNFSKKQGEPGKLPNGRKKKAAIKNKWKKLKMDTWGWLLAVKKMERILFLIPRNIVGSATYLIRTLNYRYAMAATRSLKITLFKHKHIIE